MYIPSLLSPHTLYVIFLDNSIERKKNVRNALGRRVKCGFIPCFFFFFVSFVLLFFTLSLPTPSSK